MATYTAPATFEEYKEDFPDATAQGYKIYLEERDEQNDLNETQSPTGIISYKNFKRSFLKNPNPPSESEMRKAYANMREGHEAELSKASAAPSAAPVVAAVSNASKNRVPVEGYDPKTVTYNNQSLPTVPYNYNSPERPKNLMGPEQQKVEDAKTTEFARNNNDETPQEGQSDLEKINDLAASTRAFNNMHRSREMQGTPAPTTAPSPAFKTPPSLRPTPPAKSTLAQKTTNQALQGKSNKAMGSQVPTQAAQAQADQFRRYHGTKFDADSRLDRQKMKAMQDAGVQMDKSGMGPQKPATRKTLTAANMYDNPNRKFSKGR